METVNFKPNSNKLLVKKDEKVETTSTGLFLGAQEIKEPTTGVVVAVGPEVKFFSVGDKVYFGPRRGAPVDLSEGEFILYDDNEIYGTIDK
jgi:co-chaperonin GroES (HSP10)